MWFRERMAREEMVVFVAHVQVGARLVTRLYRLGRQRTSSRAAASRRRRGLRRGRGWREAQGEEGRGSSRARSVGALARESSCASHAV